MTVRLVDRRVLLTAAGGDFCVHVAMGALSFRLAGLGASPGIMGVVGCLMDTTYCVVALLMPRFLGRFGRRSVVRVACVLIAIGALLAWRAPDILLFAAAMMVLRGGAAVFWPALQGRLSDEAYTDLGRAVAMFSMSWSAGKALGYAANSLAFDTSLLQVQDAFGVAGVIAALLFFLMPRDCARPTHDMKAAHGHVEVNRVPLSRVKVAWIAVFLGCAAYTVLVNQNAPLMRVRNQDAAFGNLLLATVVVTNFVVFGWLSRNPHLVGRRVTLMAVPVALILGLAIFHVSTARLGLLLAAVVIGGGGGLAYTQSLVLSLRLPRDSASGAGLHEAVIGFGSALVAPLAGWVSTVLDAPDGAVALGLACVAAGGVAQAVLLRNEGAARRAAA